MDIADFPLHGCEVHEKYIDELRRSKSASDSKCELVSLIHSYIHAMMDNTEQSIREHIRSCLINMCRNREHSRTVLRIFSYFSMNTIYGNRCGRQSFKLLTDAAVTSTFPKRRRCTIVGARSVSRAALNTPTPLPPSMPSVEVVFEDDDLVVV